LPNLNEAGTLYGAVIYEKAPIVMRHLEALLGPDSFREGMRQYLRRYSFANATWLDLVKILDTCASPSVAPPGAVPGWSSAAAQSSRSPG
jgi:aminopeptidase N